VRAAALALLLCVGCASPDPDARVTPPSLDVAAYAPVSATLQLRCGTLDCHGHLVRNLRLYGYGGLRLAESDRPDGVATTTAELEASVRSITALEPELAGAAPEALMFFRKATNREAHKGGARLDADGERCLRTWLTGSRDDAACARSAALQR